MLPDKSLPKILPVPTTRLDLTAGAILVQKGVNVLFVDTPPAPESKPEPKPLND